MKTRNLTSKAIAIILTLALTAGFVEDTNAQSQFADIEAKALTTTPLGGDFFDVKIEVRYLIDAVITPQNHEINVEVLIGGNSIGLFEMDFDASSFPAPPLAPACITGISCGDLCPCPPPGVVALGCISPNVNSQLANCGCGYDRERTIPNVMIPPGSTCTMIIMPGASITESGPTAAANNTLAVPCNSAAAVPSVSEWGLMVLTLLVVGGGLWMSMRRGV